MIKWNYVLKFSISKSHEQLIQQIYQPKLKSNIKKKKILKKKLKSCKVDRASDILRRRQNHPIGAHRHVTISMHTVPLTIPRGYPEPDGRRNLQPENHGPFIRPVITYFHPPLPIHVQRLSAQHRRQHFRSLRPFVIGIQQRRGPEFLVLIINRTGHWVVVNPNVEIGVSGRDIEDNLGIFQPIIKTQTRNWKIMDEKSWAVWP